MEALGIGAGAAAATNLFGYNRDAWMNDVQVHQNRRLQKQQILLSQYSLFREDIRDTTGSSITRQNNYVLIGTLLLGMMGECFIEGPMPDGASHFLGLVYSLCITSCCVFLVLAVLCAIVANHWTVKWQQNLLVKEVRLPVQDMIDELEESEAGETVEAFEQQGIQTMLRVPGFSRFRRQRPAVEAAHSLRKASFLANSQRSSTTSTSFTPGTSSASSTRKIESIVQDMEQGHSHSAERSHMEIFKEQAVYFKKLEKLSFLIIAIGLHYLLQAYAYYSAAAYYRGNKVESFIVPVTISTTDAVLTSAFFTSGRGVSSIVPILCAVLAPLSMLLGIRTDGRMDDIGLCLCFFLHLLAAILSHTKLQGAINDWDTASARKRERGLTDVDGSDASSDSSDDGTASGEAVQPARLQFRYLAASSRVTCVGAAFVILAWFAACAWVVQEVLSHKIHRGIEVNYTAPEQQLPGHRRLVVDEARDTYGAWELELVAVTWPSVHIVPRTMACAGLDSEGGRCIFANEFMVFQLRDFSAAELGQPKMEHVPCNISGSIIDVALDCGHSDRSGACRSLVLAQGPAQAFVVDCSTGDRQPLTQTAGGSATHFTVAPSGSGTWPAAGDDLLTGRGLLTAHSGERPAIVHRGRVEPDVGAWSPMWTVMPLPEGGDLVAVRASPSSTSHGGSLLLGYRDGRLELRSPGRRRAALAAAALPPPSVAGRLLSAAVTAGGSVFALVEMPAGEEDIDSGETVVLGRVRWPGGFTASW